MSDGGERDGGDFAEAEGGSSAGSLGRMGGDEEGRGQGVGRRGGGAARGDGCAERRREGEGRRVDDGVKVSEDGVCVCVCVYVCVCVCVMYVYACIYIIMPRMYSKDARIDHVGER